MKITSEMSKEQLINWAMKTRASIAAYCRRNYGMNRSQSARALELIDRYTELSDEMQLRGYWAQFCDISGSDLEHDAYDLFA